MAASRAHAAAARSLVASAATAFGAAFPKASQPGSISTCARSSIAPAANGVGGSRARVGETPPRTRSTLSSPATLSSPPSLASSPPAKRASAEEAASRPVPPLASALPARAASAAPRSCERLSLRISLRISSESRSSESRSSGLPEDASERRREAASTRTSIGAPLSAKKKQSSPSAAGGAAHCQSSPSADWDGEATGRGEAAGPATQGIGQNSGCSAPMTPACSSARASCEGRKSPIGRRRRCVPSALLAAYRTSATVAA
mmetsp:Transcript_2972/g.9701  ORF Transcript_2972/g.9701 Transcript_2972/m.9701 type:complete len:261 (+) Transcript_2972:528-1310(+)